MQYIKQNTSGKIVFGPVVKSTDGYSALTGVATGTATGSVMFVWGSSSTGDMTTAHSWEEISSGYYLVGLASNAIGTLGNLRVAFINSSAVPTYEDVRVIASNPYDSLISTDDYLNVDVLAVTNSTLGGSTDLKDNLSTASNMNIGALAGTTLGANVDSGYIQTDPQNVASTSDLLTTASNLNIGALAGTTLGSNVSSGYMQVDAPNAASTSDLLTTASNVNVGALAGTTLGANVSSGYIQAEHTTASNVNVGALAGTTLGANVSSGYIQAEHTTASYVDIGALAGTTLGANVDSGYIQTDPQNVASTSDLLTTASNINVGALAGTTLGANVDSGYIQTDPQNAITTATVYDNIDHGTLMQFVQAYTIGDFGVTGASTNVVVYDNWSGTTFMAHTLTTKTRTWSS